jgi:hypothetical protein
MHGRWKWVRHAPTSDGTTLEWLIQVSEHRELLTLIQHGRQGPWWYQVSGFRMITWGSLRKAKRQKWHDHAYLGQDREGGEPSHAFFSSAWYTAPYGIRRGAVTDASVDVGWKVLL